MFRSCSRRDKKSRPIWTESYTTRSGFRPYAHIRAQCSRRLPSTRPETPPEEAGEADLGERERAVRRRVGAFSMQGVEVDFVPACVMEENVEQYVDQGPRLPHAGLVTRWSPAA